MYQMAKTAREKLKAKARSLASEKDSKVDSSDWSPAEPLNADAKTGMRPISPRAYKGGGKVDGKEAKPRSDRKARKAGGRVETEIGVGMANKNMKEANKSRPGVKHVGGFKKGGEIKDAGVKDKKALGAIDPSPKRGAAQHYKKGGKVGRAMGGKDPSYVGASSVTMDKKPVMRPKDIEDRRSREPQARDLYGSDQMKRLERGYKKGGKIRKADGGILDTIANALAGRGYIDGSTWMKDEPVTASDSSSKSASPRRPKSAGMRRREAADKMTPAQYSREMAMAYENEQPTIRGSAATPVQSERFMKKGGKIKKADGGSLPSPEEAIGSEVRMKGLKVMPGKSATAAAQVTPAQLRREEGYVAADMKAKRPGRATGGSTLMSALKGAAKKGSKKGGKTNINIVINAGKTPAPRPEDAEKPMMGKAPPPPPMDMGAPGMDMAGLGAPAPMGMLPMGGIGSPPPAPVIGRKAGGRITKVASSYKDMEAGAASGEGRLQKTDIAKKHRDAPARKEGGRISKVAKSYKDMTAGAGSGEGRLQKEDIAKAKKDRAA